MKIVRQTVIRLIIFVLALLIFTFKPIGPDPWIMAFIVVYLLDDLIITFL